MLNTAVELIALWASSSPSLLAFCFSHLIIAVLLLGGRGCASDVDGRRESAAESRGAETLHAAQFQSSQTSSGGSREDSAVATNVGDSGCASFSANGRAVAGTGETGAGAAQLQASGSRDTDGGREGASVSADTQQARGSDEYQEDGDGIELMMRAEEFIQRMNRAWRTENVRAC